MSGASPVSPSSPVVVALHSLVKAVRQLGLPPKSDLPVVKNLVEDFVAKARALDGWKAIKEEGVAQVAFDIGFLGLLVGEPADKNTEVPKFLSKVSVSSTRWGQGADGSFHLRYHPTMPPNYLASSSTTSDVRSSSFDPSLRTWICRPSHLYLRRRRRGTVCSNWARRSLPQAQEQTSGAH